MRRKEATTFQSHNIIWSLQHCKPLLDPQADCSQLKSGDKAFGWVIFSNSQLRYIAITFTQVLKKKNCQFAFSQQHVKWFLPAKITFHNSQIKFETNMQKVTHLRKSFWFEGWQPLIASWLILQLNLRNFTVIRNYATSMC